MDIYQRKLQYPVTALQSAADSTEQARATMERLRKSTLPILDPLTTADLQKIETALEDAIAVIAEKQQILADGQRW